MDEIVVKPTSRDSAQVDDIVVREGPLTRLVFRPVVVNNPHDPAASVRGTFIYQKKRKADEWENVPAERLSALKADEGYRLEIGATELRPFLIRVNDLYKLVRAEGVPRAPGSYVRLERDLARLLALSEGELREFLSAHEGNALATLHRVLRWVTEGTALASFVEGNEASLSAVSALIGAARLRQAADVWEANAANGNEEFWQRTLSANAFVLSQVFAYPIVVVKEKAYVGGKLVDNHHGNLADYLARADTTGNAVIVELKTPTTPLLGREYRTDVFPPSWELSGAIAQVLHYRDSLMADIHRLRHSERGTLLVSEPRCLVVVGNSTQLATEAARASFERMRERTQGVVVVTYDELFGKVRTLAEMLAS